MAEGATFFSIPETKTYYFPPIASLQYKHTYDDYLNC